MPNNLQDYFAYFFAGLAPLEHNLSIISIVKKKKDLVDCLIRFLMSQTEDVIFVRKLI